MLHEVRIHRKEQVKLISNSEYSNDDALLGN